MTGSENNSRPVGIYRRDARGRFLTGTYGGPGRAKGSPTAKRNYERKVLRAVLQRVAVQPWLTLSEVARLVPHMRATAYAMGERAIELGLIEAVPFGKCVVLKRTKLASDLD